MEILIDRQWKKPEYTISRLYVNGDLYGCNTLEDTDRGLTQSMAIAEVAKKKVYGKTAIPSGTYEVVWNYSNHFKRYMPQVMNVKGFEGIRIHSGNTAKDSLGCILVGKNDKPGWISDSRSWTNKLYADIQAAIKRNEMVTLIIK